MSWFYLDDAIGDHPKIVLAGGEAAHLYIMGLAYAHRHNTKGLIPKPLIDRLTPFASASKSAKKLVDVKLWHDEGDHYRINDYEQWNAKSIEAREKAKKAAKARWTKPLESNAQALPEHMLNGHFSNAQAYAKPPDEHMLNDDSSICQNDTLAMPYEPINQITNHHHQGFTVTHDGASSSLDDDDFPDEEKNTKPQVESHKSNYETAISVIAHQRLNSSKTQVLLPENWLKSTVENLKREFPESSFAKNLRSDLIASEIISRQKSAKNSTSFDPFEATQIAQRQLANRDRSCPICEGSGWREFHDGAAIRCDCVDQKVAM